MESLMRGRRASSFLFASAFFGCQSSASPTHAPSRADSLAVIAASLEHYQPRSALFLDDSSPELVIAAAEVVTSRVIRLAGGARTICDPDLARDGENVGTLVGVSLTPGDGRGLPVENRSTDDGAPPTSLRVSVAPTRGPGFYMSEKLAYVPVSSSCYLRPLGGLLQVRFPDGRILSHAGGAVLFVLRREGSGWTITRVTPLMIT